MRVKRYVVDTMPDAMHSIRSELGSDAVILSTKEISVGGFLGLFKKKKIEVVAAVENAQKPARDKSPERPAAAAPLNVPRSAVPQAYQKAVSASAPAAAPERQAAHRPEREQARSFAEIAAALSESLEASGSGGSVAVLSAAPPQTSEAEAPLIAPLLRKEETPPVPKEETVSDLYQSLGAELDLKTEAALDNDVLREIREMKQWMERIARYSTGGADLPDVLSDLKARLLDQETDAVLVDEWIGKVYDRWSSEGRTWQQERFAECLREEISGFLDGRTIHGIAADTRIVYIAGPTGVGKTTTIAKLAAEQLFRHGRRVGMITSDTYRISAVEQLRTYAAILNIPLEVVQSPGDMQRAMFRLESCDLVLMDTAGRNYRNEMLVAELQSLLAKELKSETFLVLSMTSKSRDMKTITEHFSRYPLDKVIFTKVDETGSFGPMFNVLNDFPLKLSYLTNGQNVPDDLLPATSEHVCSLLLGTGGA
ncbi:flagellar biosynthesis protein FlhF [Paenibacillus sp. NFR01]|uniref:flagellar biosynthesis protein FlhF n=1 Tax=Paenibacillus sp. NFR01 TaxID=1566279 RepID=UPI0008C4A8B1|nr:flagellar biosynthesis protein FlhF [Paenibacillus sp. NFR01]SET43203.1 flagellar biosynthesis protein FlhF [Paenibacillus sp. NFR01]